MEALEEFPSDQLSSAYARSNDFETLVTKRSELINDLNQKNEALPPGRKLSSWLSQAMQFSHRRNRMLGQFNRGRFIGSLD